MLSAGFKECRPPQTKSVTILFVSCQKSASTSRHSVCVNAGGKGALGGMIDAVGILCVDLITIMHLSPDEAG